MTSRVTRFDLQIAPEMVEFIENNALPGTGVDAGQFWQGLSDIVHDLGPKNRNLLAKRAEIQHQIDEYHTSNSDEDYRSFLERIGYLVPVGPDFSIETTNVDPEIASIAGAQLVVPITNARFALNAANARWGSLYDALYGTDAMGDLPSGKGYDAARGAQVVAWAKAHLDKAAPLAGGKWADVTDLTVEGEMLLLTTSDGVTGLADPAQFSGHTKAEIFLQKHGLLMGIKIDPSSVIGKSDPAGISDIRLESAISAIMDCEDSVATVDAEDKVLAYTNWLGLMRADLVESFEKSGKTITRKLNRDVEFTAPAGSEISHKGRALMLIRNVGHL
ncbi:MAG: malate synthase G, partial [Rhodobacteraceae bacterium]|nr:malate synthase G [Paracoccaceae bacterium]